MKKTARLIYDNSESNADLLYATRHFVGDAFLWWEWRGKTNAVFSPLEIDRARAHARVDRIYASSDFLSPDAKDRSPAALIAAIAKKQRFRKAEVPASFPMQLARELEKRGLCLSVPKHMRSTEDPFFLERQRKSAEEVRHITAALRTAEAGLNRGIEVLRQSTIGPKGILKWAGDVLTSERLRGEIDSTILKLDALPANTIVACGRQACDPHERGHGPLRAHQTIIMDIFPRSMKTGYFGDLTRTVVKGKASPAIQRLYHTLANGKKWALAQMRAGADGALIHNTLTERFAQAGYPTEKRQGRWVGFFHGTGHGVGLAIHESPRFSAGKLFAGLCITVEPGLYYPDIGGVRLEDMVIVEKTGVRNLTRVPQILEIR
jgi:Xaa-Pro aminopeptidase